MLFIFKTIPEDALFATSSVCIKWAPAQKKHLGQKTCPNKELHLLCEEIIKNTHKRVGTLFLRDPEELHGKMTPPWYLHSIILLNCRHQQAGQAELQQHALPQKENEFCRRVLLIPQCKQSSTCINHQGKWAQLWNHEELESRFTATLFGSKELQSTDASFVRNWSALWKIHIPMFFWMLVSTVVYVTPATCHSIWYLPRTSTGVIHTRCEQWISWSAPDTGVPTETMVFQFIWLHFNQLLHTIHTNKRFTSGLTHYRTKKYTKLQIFSC